MYGYTIEGFKGYYDNCLKQDHNNSWLIDLWGEDPGRFETQILCTTGTPIEGTNKFEDQRTGEVWGPTRWPRNAYSEPEGFNPKLTYNIGARVKAIGTTWWDWKAKKTIRLGFDIDSIIGHADGVGVSDEVIEQFSSLDIPYLTVLRSTRGLGRHLYLEFADPFPVTENHHEHAAIARSLLPRLTRDAKKAGFNVDFEAEKDVCGGVMWIHHVNATKENRGYEMIRQATECLTEEDVPRNWRDHLSVVKGSRSKVLVRGWTPDGQTGGDELDEMSNANTKIELDDEHEKVLDALEDTGFSVMWVDDHHLCQTHTCALKDVHERLGLKGYFETDAPGDDPGKPNCFMRPRPGGGWDVYRFGKGTTEHSLWGLVGDWTHCFFNTDPTFEQVMLRCGAEKHPQEKHGYVFSTPASVEEALRELKIEFTLPERAHDNRAIYMKQREDGLPVLTIEKSRSDKPVDFKGFAKTGQGWQRLFNVVIDVKDESRQEELFLKFDNDVRALRKRNFTDAASKGGALTGWVVRDASQSWIEVPQEAVTLVMKSLGYDDIDMLKGDAIFNSWLLTNEPFKPEYPGGRKWNRDAPQLRYQPAQLDIDELPSHPWWDKYLNHLGSDLDDYIEDLQWPAEWNIRCGGDYLKVWLACMIRYPYDKLPYLFMWGGQETGKSMFHESIRLIITAGVEAADKALTNPQGYNGELQNTVLAYIDETDVASAGPDAYNRLKAWVTGLTMSIHAKYLQVFEAVNTCHFVQFANELKALPVFRGDKRITAMHIPPIMDPIPKDVFMKHLVEEAPHFIYTLLNWDIPDAPSRLRLPVIETASKEEAIERRENLLMNFIADNCFEVDGSKISLKDFYTEFSSFLEPSERKDWSKRAVKKALSFHFPVGRGPGNVDFIGNLTLNENAKESTPFTLGLGHRLIKKGSKDDNSSKDE